MKSSNLKLTSAIIAGLALGVPQIASAKACVAEADLADAVVYVMPVAFSTFTNKCAGQLKKDGFVARGGSKFIATYSGKQDAAWPGALRFLGTFMEKDGKGSEMTNMLKTMPPEVLRPFADAFIQAELSKQIKLKDCSKIERIIEPLAPLPPQNLGKFVATLISFMPEGRDPQMCKSAA